MLCFPGLLNGFVFPEAPTDAGLEFNRSPGENQGDGADPSLDGNRTSGTESLAVAARGNHRDLCWPDLPFELYFEQIQNLSLGRRGQFNKKTQGSCMLWRPNMVTEGNYNQFHLCEEKRWREKEEREAAERKEGLRGGQTACSSPSCTRPLPHCGHSHTALCFQREQPRKCFLGAPAEEKDPISSPSS